MLIYMQCKISTVLPYYNQLPLTQRKNTTSNGSSNAVGPIWNPFKTHVSWNDVNDSVHYDVGSVLNRVELRL